MITANALDDGAADELPGVADPAWGAVFQRTDGWTGGDGIYSCPLDDDRILWLFSDTWIGGVAEGKHAAGSKLVNNSLAIHAAPPDGTPPDREAVRFHWGPPDDEGNPTAWITPDPARVPAAGGKDKTWYWLADAITLPAPEGGRRLAIFLWHVGRKEGDLGVWGFQSVGGALAIVENPGDPVDQWRVKQYDNPHAVGSAAAANDDAVDETSWGSEIIAVTDEPDAAGAMLYIYGVRSRPWHGHQMLLARVPAARIEDFDQWQFRTADGWTSRLADAAVVADNITTEYSICRVNIGEQERWLLVHSEPFLGPRILVRVAARPEGPWSRPQPVYQVPGVAKNKAYFTYAAKGHPELSRPGELLITYVINSNDFWAMVRDADIYRPRFIRLRLSDVRLEE